MKKIVLDTNFLIDCIRFKIDVNEISRLIDEEYKIFIPSSVIKELKKISERKSKDGDLAKIAIRLIEQKGFETIETKERDTDESIVRCVEKNDVVGTDDIKLRKTLKTLGNKIIYLRAKKYLDIS